MGKQFGVLSDLLMECNLMVTTSRPTTGSADVALLRSVTRLNPTVGPNLGEKNDA